MESFTEPCTLKIIKNTIAIKNCRNEIKDNKVIQIFFRNLNNVVFIRKLLCH